VEVNIGMPPKPAALARCTDFLTPAGALRVVDVRDIPGYDLLSFVPFSGRLRSKLFR
jgi:hypothetical protein